MPTATAPRPFVQRSIDEVNTVLHDPEEHHDPDQFDRYATFEEARDAALSCVELLIDAGDYDGDDHLAELQLMLDLLESSATFEALHARPEYQAFLRRLGTVAGASAAAGKRSG